MTRRRPAKSRSSRKAESQKPQPPPSRRRPVVIAVIVAVLAGSALLLWTLNDRTTPQISHPTAIPDPDTTGMQPRVAQRIGEARGLVVKQPASADAWGRFAEVCHTHAQLPEAIAGYRQAMALAPGTFRWAYLLAIARRDAAAEAEELVRLFQNAIALDPTYAPAHVRLGDALARTGRATQAQRAYEKALQMDPQLTIARRGLGQMLLSLGDAAGAVKHLRQVLRAAPRDAPTHAALTQAYMRLGDRQSAEALAANAAGLKDALSMRDPVWEEIFNWNVQSSTTQRKALGLIARGDYRAAIPHLKQVENVDPGDPYIQLLLALAYVQTGQLPAGEKHFDRMLALRDEIVEADLPLTLAHVDEGVENYLSALARDAVAAQSDAPLDHALTELSRHRNTTGLIVTLHVNCGDEQIKRGQVQRALPHYEAALRLDNDSYKAHYMLGQIMESVGQRDRAREHYRRAAELDPAGDAARRLEQLQSGS